MRILIYANVGLNLIDGSTVWVQSISEVLAGLQETSRVTILSRDKIQPGGFAAKMTASGSSVDIVECSAYDTPHTSRMMADSPQRIAPIIVKLIRSMDYDRVIIRDPALTTELLEHPDVARRVWTYTLNTPSLTPSQENVRLEQAAEAVGGLFVQSEIQRGLLEAIIPSSNGKVFVLPPMVKTVEETSRTERPYGPVKYIYSGKYSKDYNVESYFDLPGLCRAQGMEATVTMAGDKVHYEATDPGFRGRITNKLKETPGVVWLGALSRDEAVVAARGHDLGLCFRSEKLNSSLEISTKFLEFASQGVPAVVNRTPAYEQLLGTGYPFFAESLNDVVKAAQITNGQPHVYAAARAAVIATAKRFTYDRAGDLLKGALRLNGRPAPKHRQPVRLLVASHDMKFFKHALERLLGDKHLSVRTDQWVSTKKHDVGASRNAIEWADVILCEWCAGPAVWYSHHKREGQKLYVRLHRFEAFTDFPKDLHIDSVDGVVVVNDYLKALCVEKFSWPADKIHVLPQYVDSDQFARSKREDARFTIGLVGINPFLKRPDRALYILQKLREADPRYRLRIRSTMPWDIPWVWSRDAERERYLEFFGSANDSGLREAILFDRPGPDMAEWFRGISYILSTSDIEGCHTSVAEGLCSGALPVVYPWDGAESVYGNYVCTSTDAMVEMILENGEGPSHAATIQMRDAGRLRFDIDLTMEMVKNFIIQ